MSHVDGGANSHITTDPSHYVWFQHRDSLVTMANNGTKSPSTGYGVILAQFDEQSPIFPLFPVYYMPDNEWPTISTPALKAYNDVQRAGVNALEGMFLVEADGVSHDFPSSADYRA